VDVVFAVVHPRRAFALNAAPQTVSVLDPPKLEEQIVVEAGIEVHGIRMPSVRPSADDPGMSISPTTLRRAPMTTISAANDR
jgi:hypothetical protein